MCEAKLKYLYLCCWLWQTVSAKCKKYFIWNTQSCVPFIIITINVPPTGSLNVLRKFHVNLLFRFWYFLCRSRTFKLTVMLEKGSGGLKIILWLSAFAYHHLNVLEVVVHPIEPKSNSWLGLLEKIGTMGSATCIRETRDPSRKQTWVGCTRVVIHLSMLDPEHAIETIYYIWPHLTTGLPSNNSISVSVFWRKTFNILLSFVVWNATFTHHFKQVYH